MYRSNASRDAQRIGAVLADLKFPAAKWQLIMHAEHYGADAPTRAQMWSLPQGVYADRTAVLVALGLVAGPQRTARQRRTGPATGRVFGVVSRGGAPEVDLSSP